MDSTKLKAIIVDDEPAAIRILKHFCNRSQQIEVLKTFRNPLEVPSFLSENSVDILFLDINMPEISGINLLKSLQKPPLVIFTTAYSEFAIESYSYSVVDYLLKPISFPRFLEAINKCRKQLITKNLTSDDLQIVTIREGTKIYRIKKQEIIFAEAYGNYVKLITKNERIIIKSTFQSFLENFSNLNLIRIHKSFAVVKNHVTEIRHNKLSINDIEIPIGRKYKEIILREF